MAAELFVVDKTGSVSNGVKTFTVTFSTFNPALGSIGADQKVGPFIVTDETQFNAFVLGGGANIVAA